MVWPPAPFTSVTFMQVSVTYSDRLSGQPYLNEGYWLVIFPGSEGAVTGMNQQQRETCRSDLGTVSVIIQVASLRPALESAASWRLRPSALVKGPTPPARFGLG